MKLETLYKRSSTGATQVINMEVIGSIYTRTWGQLGGKMQTKSTTAKGKNIGKANETTPEEQAISEAEAVWVKKKKANYSTSQKAPVTVKLPMKVNKYQGNESKVIFPCYTSNKLNGVNAEYRLVDGELKLLSRGGEEYPIPEHQRQDVLDILDALCTTSLNGEMYIHGEHLQDIMSATKKPNKLTPRLIFWVFDCPEITGDYAYRSAEAYSTVWPLQLTTAMFVPVNTAHSLKDIDNQHGGAVSAGYEGLIIRNGRGLYKYNTRSLDVFKYKVAMDSEFEVIGHDLDKNQHVVFTCKAGNKLNSTFKVKCKGTAEARLEMAENAEQYIGKYLKVEYEMLSRDGIPLKPVGIMFREVDSNMEATE